LLSLPGFIGELTGNAKSEQTSRLPAPLCATAECLIALPNPSRNQISMRKSKATEALQVATDIAAIRTALKKRGYTIRKQPKQAAWAVSVTPNECYLLTYQPAPISGWVLHPQNNNPNRQSLLNT